MKKLLFFLKDKCDLISFWSGIVSSFACTIIYESIVEVSAPDKIVLIQYILKWVSSIFMIICSLSLLNLSSKLKDLESRYNRLLALAKDSERGDLTCLFNTALNKQSEDIFNNKKHTISSERVFLKNIYTALLLLVLAFFTLLLAQVVK